jgi:DNA-binding GntR family transcriptional regulator
MNASLTTVSRCTRSGQVYMSIKQAILAGHLAPGCRLTEKSIMEQLEVSRSTVREATSRLAHEGYLKGKPYEGYRVNLPTLTDVEEIYEILIELSKITTRLALIRADEKEVGELVTLLDLGEEALARGEVEVYSDAGWRLRILMAEYSHNQHLYELYDQMAHHPDLIRPWAIDDVDSVRRRAPDFDILRQAIKDRNGEKAGAILAEHLRMNFQEVITKYMISNQTPDGQS